MALVVAERREGRWRDRVGTVDVLLMLAVAAVPAVLILAQPDLGTMLVLSATVFGVVAASGAHRRWLAVLLGSGVSVAVFAVATGSSSSTRSTGSSRSPTPVATRAAPATTSSRRGSRRQRRPVRPGPLRRLADQLGLRPRAAHRLRLHRRRRGARPGRRRLSSSRARHRDLARAGDPLAHGRRVRPDRRRRIACGSASRPSRTSGCASDHARHRVPLPFVSYGGSSMFAGMLAHRAAAEHPPAHDLRSRLADAAGEAGAGPRLGPSLSLLSPNLRILLPPPLPPPPFFPPLLSFPAPPPWARVRVGTVRVRGGRARARATLLPDSGAEMAYRTFQLRLGRDPPTRPLSHPRTIPRSASHPRLPPSPSASHGPLPSNLANCHVPNSLPTSVPASPAPRTSGSPPRPLVPLPHNTSPQDPAPPPPLPFRHYSLLNQTHPTRHHPPPPSHVPLSSAPLPPPSSPHPYPSPPLPPPPLSPLPYPLPTLL